MSRDTIRLPHDAYRLLQTLRAAGHSAYVVGGCVRDSLLGRLPGDWDICTSARPDEMKALFCSQRLILTGEKHGTVAVILHGKPYEMTTYRLDGSYRDHRHPDNVQFVDDLAADLARRDFTINAMAYAPGEGVIDLYGGRSDLAARVVRCVGTPADRFAEDALRILRALRFSAKLGFALDPATAAAALTARDTLHTVSAERLYTELDGLLLAPGAGQTLAQYGEILSGAVPEILPCIGCTQPENGIATTSGSILPPPWAHWTCAGRTPAACGCCAGPRFCMTLPSRSAAASGRTGLRISKATTSAVRSWRGSSCAA